MNNIIDKMEKIKMLLRFNPEKIANNHTIIIELADSLNKDIKNHVKKIKLDEIIREALNN